MKILYNINDEKEMKALMGFGPVYNGKKIGFSHSFDSSY